MADLADSKLMVQTVLHLMSCTSGQQDTFISILRGILSQITFNTNLTNFLPTNSHEVYAYCLHGKNSILGNLPCTPVKVLNGGHAVISLDSVIDNMFALGVDVHMMQDENGVVDRTGIHGTKVAAKMLHQLRLESDDPNNTAFGFFTCWSDGFLTSYVCQKDNSVWILTVTFLDPKGSATSQFHTIICLAMGHSMADHSEVINYFLEEFKIVRQCKKRYSSIKGKFINTSFALIAYLADLPERCSVMKTSLKGSFGRRVMWTCFTDPKKFPYCKRCFKQAIDQVFGLVFDDQICNRCCGWSCKLTASTSRILRTKPIDHYPTTVADGAPQCPEYRSTNELVIYPIRQTFCFLKMCVEFACYNAIHHSAASGKRWSGKEFTAYLRTCGVSTKARDMAWSNVQDARKGTTVLSNVSPKVWDSCLDMSCFVAAILHLLFHGVTPDIMELIFTIIKENSLGTPFNKHVNVILKDIADLRLEWLKIKMFPPTQWLALLGPRPRCCCPCCRLFDPRVLSILVSFSSSHIRPVVVVVQWRPQRPAWISKS